MDRRIDAAILSVMASDSFTEHQLNALRQHYMFCVSHYKSSEIIGQIRKYCPINFENNIPLRICTCLLENVLQNGQCLITLNV